MGLLRNLSQRIKQHKADVLKREAEQQTQITLEKERAANGHCPRCNSDKLQAVSTTTSKQAFGSGSNVADLAYGLKQNPTHQKLQSSIVRVCLNCGRQFI